MALSGIPLILLIAVWKFLLSVEKSAYHFFDVLLLRADMPVLNLFFYFVIFLQLAFMFERLQAVKHYDGYVILLEEDHYVVEDILHVKKLVENIWM